MEGKVMCLQPVMLPCSVRYTRSLSKDPCLPPSLSRGLEGSQALLWFSGVPSQVISSFFFKLLKTHLIHLVLTSVTIVTFCCLQPKEPSYSLLSLSSTVLFKPTYVSIYVLPPPHYSERSTPSPMEKQSLQQVLDLTIFHAFRYSIPASSVSPCPPGHSCKSTPLHFMF